MENKLKLVLTYSISDIRASKENAELFANTFYELFGSVPCISCTGELQNAINRLKLYSTQKINQMKNTKYKFNCDRMLWSDLLHKHFTKDNLTDEAAETLIKENPEYEKFFDTSDPIITALENFEAGDNEKSVSISNTKTLDKKQVELKVKAKRK